MQGIICVYYTSMKTVCVWAFIVTTCMHTLGICVKNFHRREISMASIVTYRTNGSEAVG